MPGGQQTIRVPPTIRPEGALNREIKKAAFQHHALHLFKFYKAYHINQCGPIILTIGMLYSPQVWIYIPVSMIPIKPNMMNGLENEVTELVSQNMLYMLSL